MRDKEVKDNNLEIFLSDMTLEDYRSEWFQALGRSSLADLFNELPYPMPRSLEEKIKEASGADSVETVEEYIARGGKISGSN